MKATYTKSIVLGLLLAGFSAEAFGQRFQLKRTKRRTLRPLILPGGAKLFHRSGEFDLSHDLTVDPKASYRKVKLYWNTQKIKASKGVLWQISRKAFPAFAGGKASDMSPNGLVKSGQGKNQFGLFIVDFKPIRQNVPNSKPFYARAIPVDGTGKKAVGKPTNVIKIYYGKGPTQPPTKFKDRFQMAEFAKRMRSALHGKVAGYQIVISKSGEKTVYLAGGYARGPKQSPTRQMSTYDRMNIASVNKTITAVATMQLLKKRSLTINSKIYPWLPKTWVRGPGIDTITFKELMTHRSGFRNNHWKATDYASLKAMIKKGINLRAKLTAKYQNQNFGLLRIIIPILDGYHHPTHISAANEAKAAKQTADWYLNYINKKLFLPSAIARVYAKPMTSSPALAYKDTKALVGGTTHGDWTMICGGGCLHMSARDLDRFLRALRYGTLISQTQLKTMLSNRLGVGATAIKVKNGYYYSHGGVLKPYGSYQGHMRTAIFHFTNGVNMSLIVNSDMPKKTHDIVKEAFNASWGL